MNDCRKAWWGSDMRSCYLIYAESSKKSGMSERWTATRQKGSRQKTEAAEASAYVLSIGLDEWLLAKEKSPSSSLQKRVIERQLVAQ